LLRLPFTPPPSPFIKTKTKTKMINKNTIRNTDFTSDSTAFLEKMIAGPFPDAPKE